MSKFKAEKSSQMTSTCHGGSSHERLLSEPSRAYMLVYYLYVCIRQYMNILSVRIYIANSVTMHNFRAHVLKRKYNALNAFRNFQTCRKNP
jgi:hypothetical protein